MQVFIGLIDSNPQTTGYCPMSRKTGIDYLVEEYLATHPEFEYPQSGDTHPAILACGQVMKPWLMDRLGGPLSYWNALLTAAKYWFEPDCDPREFRIFCYFFEAEGCLGYMEGPGYQPLIEDYNAWRMKVRSAIKNRPDS